MFGTDTASASAVVPVATPAHGRRSPRRVVRAFLAASFVALLTMAGTTTGAAAASNPVGNHSRAEVTCDALPGRMLVHLPMVSSVPISSANQFTVGGWTGGGTHPQWVGVRVWLLRWDARTARWAYTDQNNDGYLDHGPLLQVKVLSDGNLFDSTWWNADAKRSIAPGDTQLAIRYSGHYKVNVEYFWYADAYVGAGYDVLDSQSHLYEQFTVVSKPYCTY